MLNPIRQNVPPEALISQGQRRLEEKLTSMLSEFKQFKQSMIAIDAKLDKLIKKAAKKEPKKEPVTEEIEEIKE